MKIVYFSNISGFTETFIKKLDLPAIKIPVNYKDTDFLPIDEDFVLITPTYGAGSKGFVPKQVVKFLNIEPNRNRLQGVIASGNRTFGEDYGKAGNIISNKCNVPLLYKFELAGFDSDIDNVRKGLNQFWVRRM